jgi:ABC-type branched-subunit amino acid transport system substrate-binding protein
MEALTKRILAIVIIAVIGVGIGVGAWFFLLAPGAGEYQWSASDAPGAPAGTPANRIIKIGVAGDVGEITGDGAWEGTYLAAKQVNQLTAAGGKGGLYINGTPYYIGVTKEDTDEANPNLVTSRGIAAAERLVYNKKVDFAIGGFRSEALLAYREVFMEEEIVFIDTGAATDIFCTDVQTWYARYKYFWRFMPINSTSLGGQIFAFLLTHLGYLNATQGGVIDKIGIIYEDLTWTESLVNNVNLVLPLYGYTIAADIAYDVTLTSADMLSHVNTLITAGCDVVIPVISAQGGLMLMQHYATLQPDFILVGIDVQSQLDTYWTQSGGACAYECIMQSIHDTNKTPTTKAFWSDFRTEWGHDPLYTASGSYDAVNSLVWSINETNSINSDVIVAKMETITKGAVLATPENFPSSVGGLGAFWPGSHDLVAGYPYGYTLFCQWRSDGTKEIVSSLNSIYPDAALENLGPLEIPPWVTFT